MGIYEGVLSAVLVSFGVPFESAIVIAVLDHALKKLFNLAVGIPACVRTTSRSCTWRTPTATSGSSRPPTSGITWSCARYTMNRYAHAPSPGGDEGFTFAEILAAMLFLAILVPVILQAVTVSNRMAMVAARRADALQVAENQLEEALLIEAGAIGTASGEVDRNGATYRWERRTSNWTEDDLVEVAVGVTFRVHEYAHRVPRVCL